MGFRVVALETLIFHCGSVALFYKEPLRFAVEAHQHHSPKVARFQVAAGGHHWYILGCYLPPVYASAMECNVVSIVQWLQVTELFVSGYFNNYIYNL